MAEFSFNTIFKFADDTAVVGLVYNSKEKVYLEEMGNLACWYQNNLLLNVSKSFSKELKGSLERKQRHYSTPRINGAPVEQKSISMYL